MENTIVKLLTTCKSYNYNRIKKGKIMDLLVKTEQVRLLF